MRILFSKKNSLIRKINLAKVSKKLTGKESMVRIVSCSEIIIKSNKTWKHLIKEKCHKSLEGKRNRLKLMLALNLHNNTGAPWLVWFTIRSDSKKSAVCFSFFDVRCRYIVVTLYIAPCRCHRFTKGMLIRWQALQRYKVQWGKSFQFKTKVRTEQKEKLSLLYPLN